MSARRSGASFELREQLAQEAARLMAESGIQDFGLAKRKAAERLGISHAGVLPSNSRIQECLAERQRIFAPASHDRRLSALRRLATDVMAQLEAFRPRLVGAVLAGTVTINSAVELHAFTDSPEMVAAELATHGVSPRDVQRRYRFGGQRVEQLPGFSFVRDGELVEVMVFPERAAHHAPLSPVDQRPMRRAGRDAVLAMLAADGDTGV
ncbi:MAG TPA: hypothetical protein VFX89_07510 [Gammaproteobacteria bacterium]|nr:hypothetical protein [Gammaproteobacteria bacterium]